MTEREALKLALEALEDSEDQLAKPYSTDVRRAIAAIKEALREHAMYEVQRLGQEIQPEQEPVALPCCGYTDASAIKWNPYNQVVQCHNCGQVYTTPPQRTWIGLTDEERDDIILNSTSKNKAVAKTEAKLKEKNHG